jgi:hypothetical protein
MFANCDFMVEDFSDATKITIDKYGVSAYHFFLLI